MDNNQQYTSKGKKTLGTTATVLGAVMVGGLFAGGGTLALWNDSETSEQYEFTSGNLQIEQTSEGVEIFNASEEDSEFGEQLNKEDLVVVPGNTYRVTQGFDIALEGKNLVADVDTTDIQGVIEASAQSEDGNSLVNVDNIRILDADGEVLAAKTAGSNTYTFASQETEVKNYGVENQHTVTPEFDQTADFVVEYEVEFSPDATNREAQNETVATINPIEVELHQQIVE